VADPIRAGIQKILDAHGDGWTAAEYVVSVNLQRITVDSQLQEEAWWYAPPRQAEWKTDGLLLAVEALRAANISED
jgi:hypothetical protein